jgi:16S rRNA (adenine1518-N6/adenine1519-N6)-dimethyltransferase
MNDSHARDPSKAHSQKALMERYGLRPKRHFGQNFLNDSAILSKLSQHIAEGAASTVEIGAGLGALTRPLLEHGLKVTAIERDRDLIPVLHREFESEVNSAQLTLLEADAKTADYPALLAALPAPRVLAGNLPYQLTGPLLRLVPHLAPLLARAVFLVQLEVADRLAAQAGSREYGALSVFTQAAFTVRRAFVVRSGAFLPQPQVDSAVVLLTPLEQPVSRETPAFVALVHAAFQQRRKTLRNAWRGVRDLSADELSQHAQSAGIDLGARGETLTVEQFARMAQAISL